MKKPNIVFFFTDQQRYDTIGCNNPRLQLTPNLDRMAKEGALFSHAYTCQPVCGPARACLQTGQYATQNGCFMNGIPLPEDAITLPKLFRANGYTTAYIGKWHLSNTFKDPVTQNLRGGWNDYWLGADALEYTASAYGGYLWDNDNKKVCFDNYRVDAVSDFAIDYINQADPEQPFFLFISHLEPHHQNDQKRYIAPKGYAEQFRDAYVPDDLAKNPIFGDWRENLADYYGAIKRIDEKFGELIEALKEKGIYDNTVILFTSDHGSHFRTRNEEYKRSCHEASLRIPLVIRGGVFTGGYVNDQQVSLIDLPETLLDIAGIAIPASMQGRSLLELIKGDCPDWPDEIFAQISESQVGRCICTKDFKFGVTAPGKDGCKDSCSDIYVPEYLYDLSKDPYELYNVVNTKDYQTIQADLTKRLIERMAAAGEKRPIIKNSISE